MRDFLFIALDKEGQRVSGEMEASDATKVKNILHAKGLIIVRIDPVKSKHWIWYILQPVKPQLLALWIRQVSVMLHAGIALAQALNSLLPKTGPKHYQVAMQRLLSDVENGYSLSQAMMRRPEFFSHFMIGSTRVGEHSGRLAETLDRCASHYEKEYSYSLKLKQALVYPTVLLTCAGALVTFIFTYMVPKFVTIFVDLNMQLPGSTRLLVSFGQFFERYGPVVFGTAVGPVLVFLYVFHYWAKTRSGKASIERMLLRTPWYGQQVHYRMLSAYFRSFATLLDSGVPLYASLQLLSRSLDRELLRRTAVAQVETVRVGKQLITAMNSQKLFPTMTVEMVAVGEESGTVDRMMYRLAEYYDSEMVRGLETIGKLVEPVILMGLGGAVAFVLMAAFQPIYQLASSF
ncbi:type II secretion system F family protein [bacterium]|nr:type II secretion system F family protein [bacterium]